MNSRKPNCRPDAKLSPPPTRSRLARFADVYDDVATLNRCFRDRLATIEMRDANSNALIHLDCFAVFGSMGIEEEELALLEPVFRGHLT